MYISKISVVYGKPNKTQRFNLFTFDYGEKSFASGRRTEMSRNDDSAWAPLLMGLRNDVVDDKEEFEGLGLGTSGWVVKHLFLKSYGPFSFGFVKDSPSHFP